MDLPEASISSAKRKTKPSRCSRFGQRHVLVILALIGQSLAFAMRVSLSVALVAMVGKQSPSSHTNISSCSQSQTGLGDAQNSSVRLSLHLVFDWPRDLQGLVLGAFFWGYLLTQIPSGVMTRHFSCKLIYGLGNLWSGVLTLLTPLAARTSVYCLISLRVCIGLGEGFTFPAMLSLISRWSPPHERATLCAIGTLGVFVGTTLGQVVAGSICESDLLGGWPSVFYLFGSLTVLWIGPWLIMTTDLPEEHPWISKHELSHILGQKECTDIETQSFKRYVAVPWRLLLTDSAVWAYTVCTMGHAWIVYTFLTCLPQFISDRLGFPLTTNGLIAAAPYLSSLPMALFSAYSSDRIIESGRMNATDTRKLFQTFASLGLAACLFGAAFASCQKPLIVALIIGAFAFDGCTRGGIHPNTLDHAPAFAGTILGISNTLATITGIIAPAVTDFIVSNGTSAQWTTVLVTCAVVSLGQGIVFLLFGSAALATWAEEPAFNPLLQRIPVDNESDSSILDEHFDTFLNSVDPSTAGQFTHIVGTWPRSQVLGFV